MDGIILALIALRNEFRPPQKPLTGHEFRPTEVGALARCYRVEEAGQDRLMLKANRKVRP